MKHFSLLINSSCLLILLTTSSDVQDALLALLVATIPVAGVLFREWMKSKLNEICEEQHATRAVIERATARTPHSAADTEIDEEIAK